MSSEILFRGKRKDNGEWVYGTPIVMHHNDERTHLHHFIIPDGVDLSFGVKVEDILVEIIPETRGQDTGLRDRNGRKIFGGDVVDILTENEEIGVIKWDNDTARFVIESDGFFSDFDNYYGTDLEIIGNIYDNPELLEEE